MCYVKLSCIRIAFASTPRGRGCCEISLDELSRKMGATAFGLFVSSISLALLNACASVHIRLRACVRTSCVMWGSGWRHQTK